MEHSQTQLMKQRALIETPNGTMLPPIVNSSVARRCEASPNFARRCEPRTEFQNAARRVLIDLGRGYVTPDPACSENLSAEPAKQRCILPGLNRGWQTPDPISMRRSIGSCTLLPTLEALQAARDRHGNACESAHSPRQDLDNEICGRTRSKCVTQDSISTATPEDRDDTASMVTSSLRWHDPGETVVIVDWDDTLFPTSWLYSKDPFLAWKDIIKNLGIDCQDVPLDLSVSDWEELDEFDKVARNFLISASSLGRVCCVTLSASPWQEITMKRILPRLARAWGDLRIPVYYASEERARSRHVLTDMKLNACFDEEEAAELTKQKHATQKSLAMRKCLNEHCGESWKNVVSIGDGQAEYDAMIHLSFQHLNPVSHSTGKPKSFRAKTVRLLQGPECATLASELELLQAWLPRIVCTDDDDQIVMASEEDAVWAMHDKFGAG